MPEQPSQLTKEQQQAFQEKLKNMSPEELREFQKQQCIFCQITAGKIPSKKIYEDGYSLAILDIAPAAQGHILLLPKEHYAIMPQVPAEVLDHLFVVSKKLSQLQLRALKVSGTSLFIANGLAAGQKAQHFMIHLIPRKEGDIVLAGGEKVIDETERSKIIPLLEKKFNLLMGLKREVVKISKKGDEKIKEAGGEIVEAEFEEEKRELKTKEEFEGEEEEKEKEFEKEEKEFPEKAEKTKKRAEEAGKPAAKGKKAKKAKEEESEKEEGGEGSEENSKEEIAEASLDEIAELFR